jgi:hypothetical protein
VIHQKRIGQTGAVERAVKLHGYNGLAVMLGYLHDIQRNIDGEYFLIGPFFDRNDATNFPPDVIDDGIRDEAGLKRVSIMGIDRPDVSIDLGSFIAFFINVLPRIVGLSAI